MLQIYFSPLFNRNDNFMMVIYANNSVFALLSQTQIERFIRFSRDRPSARFRLALETLADPKHGKTPPVI